MYFSEGNRLKLGHQVLFILETKKKTTRYLYNNSSTLHSFCFQFENFIGGCTFKQRDCLNETNFWASNVPTYGNCFTFNTRIKEVKKRLRVFCCFKVKWCGDTF